MATITQAPIKELQNEKILSAAAYIRAYRPWHSLYNQKIRLEANPGEDVSSGLVRSKLILKSLVCVCHRQHAFYIVKIFQVLSKYRPTNLALPPKTNAAGK